MTGAIWCAIGLALYAAALAVFIADRQRHAAEQATRAAWDRGYTQGMADARIGQAVPTYTREGQS